MCDMSAVSVLESGEQRYIKAINNTHLVLYVTLPFSTIVHSTSVEPEITRDRSVRIVVAVSITECMKQ